MKSIALITGASQGLGKTLAGFLARQDYDLILTARGLKALESAAEDLSGEGARIFPIAGDVSDPDHRAALIAAAQALGGLDLLINNASTLGPSPLPPLAGLPLEALRRIFEVNAIAPLALVQAALPHLEARGGLVVNLSSDAARGGYEGWGGYGASKAALDLISLTLANELRAAGVGVVSVDPGDLRTEMHQAAYPGEDIGDRPLPDVTLPFWGWLLGQNPLDVSGQRFQAQAETWAMATPAL